VLNTHATPDGEAVVTDDRGWAIYTCGHGCLHLALDRVMLTLTADEFHALQHLMRRACDRFHAHALLHAALRSH
jgi:hypothetical protein